MVIISITLIHLISGTNKDGTYAASTTLSSSTHPPGNLRLYHKRIQDINDFFSNSFRPDPYNLTVTNYDCSSITPSNGLDVSQTGVMQDITGDNVFSVGDRIVYTITLTNSGNTTITGLDFVSTLSSSQGSYTIGDLSKYIPSQNNRSDGFIIPGGQAALYSYTYHHLFRHRDFREQPSSHCISSMWRNRNRY